MPISLPSEIATLLDTAKGSLDSLFSKSSSSCDMFGTIGSMFPDIDTNAIQHNLSEAMKSIGKVLKQVNDFISKVAEKISGIITAVSNLAAELITAATNAIIDAISILTSAVSTIVGKISDAVTGIIGKINDAFKKLGDSISKSLASDCNLVSAAVGAIGSGASAMVDAIAGGASTIAASSLEAIQGALDGLSNMSTGHKNIFDAISVANIELTLKNTIDDACGPGTYDSI